MRGSKLDKTRLEANVFEYIQTFTMTNGFAPAIRDICKGCDIKSTATVYYIINDLCDKGLLRKPGKNMRRAVGVVSSSVVAPSLTNNDPGNGIFSLDNYDEFFTIPSNLFTVEDPYIFTQSDDGLKGLGIMKGDKIIIHKTNDVKDGDLVEVVLGGRARCRKLAINGKRYTLIAANDAYDNIEIDKSAIIGKVDGIMRQY